MKPYKIIVDTKRLKTYGTNTIEGKQGDKDSRIVNAIITADGIPLDLTNKIVAFYAIKPDETKIFNSTTIKKASDGEVEFNLTTQVLAVEGKVKGELAVFGADGYKLTSALFIIEVIKSINDESAIESQNEFTLLTDALTKLTTWDNQFETKYNALEQEYATELTTVKSQLAEKAQQSDLDDTNSEIENISTELDKKLPRIPSHLLAKIKNKVNFPDGWTWTDAPINIYQSGDGTITTDFEASDYEHVGNGKTYYLSTNGDINNDGLTLETAQSLLSLIFQKGDVDNILVDDGYYDYEEGTNQADIQKNISIKALNGDNADVTISTNATLNFSKTEGYTNVYNASRTVVASVFDGEELVEGDMTKLKEVGSVEEADSTPGSYFYSSPNIYIHPINSRVPDEKIKVFLNVYNLRNTGNHTTYSENIKWHGGNHGSAYISTNASRQNTLFVAKNCEFKYSTEGSGGLTILGADAYLQNCIASSNKKDGLNYHSQNDSIPKVIEVGCKGFRNGEAGDYTNQGSTIHDGGKIIRINGEYYKNNSANIVDVSENTESWNLGCDSHDSATTLDDANANYSIEAGKMWLDSCIGYNSNKKYRSLTEGTLYIRNSLFDDGEEDVKANLVEY